MFQVVTLWLAATAATVRMMLFSADSAFADAALGVDDTVLIGAGEPYLAQADTSRPRLPKSRALPDDSTRTLPSPFRADERYYRDIVGVMFDDTTSGRTIRVILRKYQASIVAGGAAFPHPVYYLQLPDPGGTYAAIDSVARAIDNEVGVFSTYVPLWRSRVEIRARARKSSPP